MQSPLINCHFWPRLEGSGVKSLFERLRQIINYCRDTVVEHLIFPPTRPQRVFVTAISKSAFGVTKRKLGLCTI